ncbi:MAG: fibronectin type III domain-containing protein [Eubacterium sp.]|nr:fibronectin type III domain-containing protein [Eubacterium sp.]
MFKNSFLKKISLCLTITLIICSVSAFVLPKNTKAEETESTAPQVEATTVQNETTIAQQETTMSQEETTTSEPVNPDEYELVAHRGLSAEAPENSMPAFQRAVDAGFKHIELDIRRCKEKADGTADWVISHDETLKRLCGVDKKVSDMYLDEIKNYSYTAGNNINQYSNVKVVSLQELISYIKKVKNQGLDVDWRIELKKLEDEEKAQIEDEVVEPIKKAGVDDCVTFISFYYSNLYNAIRNNTHIKICYLAEILESKYLDYAISLRDKWHAKIDTVIFRGSTYTTDESEMKAAMDEGFKLGVYAIDSRVMMGTYYGMGVRSFTTNKVRPTSMSVSLMKHKYSIKDFTFKLSKRTYTFTNTRKKPKFTITYEGEELLENLCFETSYANNRYPGTATATATGLRNISGEKDKTFSINMPKVKGFKIVKNSANSIKCQWTPNTNVKGYKVYQYNYATNKYKLVKTISKNTTKTFTAKNLQTATKYRYRVKTYFTYKTKTYNSAACAGKTTYTKPAAEKSIKIKRTKKGKVAKVTVGRLARVTGYNIKISTNKNFLTDVRTVSTKYNSVKFKRLKKKKTYYAKARGYKKVGRVYYYGAYSKVVKKKGKKSKKSSKKKAS